MSWMSNKIISNLWGMGTRMSAECWSRCRSFVDVLEDISRDVKLPRRQRILFHKG